MIMNIITLVSFGPENDCYEQIKNYVNLNWLKLNLYIYINSS